MDILYVCSLCGWLNKNKESVEKCERNHVKKEDIIISKIEFAERQGNGVPEFLFVEIKQNKFIYKLQ